MEIIGLAAVVVPLALWPDFEVVGEQLCKILGRIGYVM
jgi:hypothetical protein